MPFDEIVWNGNGDHDDDDEEDEDVKTQESCKMK